MLIFLQGYFYDFLYLERCLGKLPHDNPKCAEIAAIFAICDCDAHRGPQKSLAISETRENNVALPFKGAMESDLLGPAFGRTDFSRIFIFEPPDFFADFLAGFFLLIFVGKSAQKNPPGKSPGKSSKIYTTKILRHISADWPGQDLGF